MDEKRIRSSLAARLRRPGAKAEVLRARAMGRAVQALRGGSTFAEAAAKAGVTTKTIGEWRRKSPAFGEACIAAVAESDQPMLVVPRGGVAKWQLQRSGRRHRFTAERKAVYLEHFAATCDGAASAEAAGVCVSTVHHHRRTDPDFAAEWRATKEQSYEHLEAEMIRLRLQALERMRNRGDGLPSLAEEEFDRALQLLREHHKTQAGSRRGEGVARTSWDFAKSLGVLEKKLKAFGIRVEKEEAEESGSEGK